MKNKKKLITLLLIIALIIIILVCGILLKQNWKSNNTSNTELDSEKLYLKFNGGFSNNKNELLYIYVFDSKNLNYMIKGKKEYFSGFAEIEGNTAHSNEFDLILDADKKQINLVAKDNSIDIESSTYDWYIIYSAKAFYENNIGDTEYLLSEESGEYYLKDDASTEILLIKTSETDIEVKLIRDGDLLYLDFFKKENDNAYVTTSNNENGKIVFEGNNINFSTDDESLKMYNGIYEKKHDIDVDKLIKDRYDFDNNSD